jgi:Protein of unknown function (DUF1566)
VVAAVEFVMNRVSAFVVVAMVLSSLAAARAGCYDRAGGSQHRFVLNGAEASDTKTGLIWQRCSVGLLWGDKGTCRGQIAFLSLDDAKRMASAAGTGWRVPSGPELESIVDRRCGSPVVDSTVFPDIRPDEEGAAKYWTTNAVGAANLMYYFDFMTGQADGHSRGIHLAVRLVRDAH